MPKLSFVMPAFNAGRFISKAIESVINQTCPDWELVIVDDASTDNTAEVVNKYKTIDDRIRYVRNVHNTGSAVLPRLRAVRESKGEWISSLDADDYVDKCFVETVLSKQSQCNSDIVFVTMKKFNEDGVFETIPTSTFDYNQIITGREACARTIVKWEFPFNGCCCRRELYTDSVLNDTRSEQNRDDIIARQLFLNAHYVSFCHAVYFYRQHVDSIIHKFSLGRFDNIELSKELSGIIKDNFSDNERVIEEAFESVFYTVVGYITYLDKNKQKLSLKDWHCIDKRLANAYEYVSHNKNYIKDKRIRLFLNLGYRIASRIILFKEKFKS